MAITVPTAPAQSLQVLNATIQNWMTHPTSAPQAENTGITFAGADGINIHLPHPVYNLSLTDLAQAKGIGNAILVAWRYILSDGESAVLAEIAQVSGSSGNQTPTFTMINRGPFVASLVQAVDLAGKNATLQAGNFDIAVMHIPALYVMALWLQGRVPGTGTLIPLAPVPAPLNAGQTYTEQGFIQALVPAAQRSLQQGGSARA